MDNEKTAQTVVTLGGWSTKIVAITVGVFFLLGIALGGWAHYSWTNADWMTKLHDEQMKRKAAESKPPEVKEVVKTETQTSVQYVPKETVKYVEVNTGRQVTAAEMSSLDVNMKAPDFFFTVNGNPAKFSKTGSERWVFDQNKGRLDQTSVASIDIKVPMIDKSKRTGVGIYASTEASGLFVTSGSILLMGGAKYGGGVSAGAGMQIRF